MTENFPDDQAFGDQAFDDQAFGQFSYQSDQGDCDEADVVVASRVQLFRNIADHSFVGVSSEDQLNDVRKAITDCIDRLPGMEELPIVDSQQLREIERQFLMALQSVIDASAGQDQSDDPLRSGDMLLDQQLFPQSLSESEVESDARGSDLSPVGDDAVELPQGVPFDAIDPAASGKISQSIQAEDRLESLFLDRIAEATSMADLQSTESGLQDSQANPCDRWPSHEISVTLNDEDHLRLQMQAGGYCLNKMWQTISKLDDRFEQSLNYAFSPRWGYLSASPANVGTAMRATVLLHLPALSILGRLDSVFSRLLQDGIAGRGAFDDQASGDFYRIGNQMTLGRTESSLINLVTCVIPSIVDYERKARKLLLEQYGDRIVTQSADACRALKLKVRRSPEEMLSLISSVRLGVAFGLVTPDQAVQVQSNFELTRLKRKLETAVKLEQYASATKYRDQIRQLEQRHYGH